MQISSDEPAEPLGLQISCSELLAVVASYVGGAVKEFWTGTFLEKSLSSNMALHTVILLKAFVCKKVKQGKRVVVFH